MAEKKTGKKSEKKAEQKRREGDEFAGSLDSFEPGEGAAAKKKSKRTRPVNVIYVALLVICAAVLIVCGVLHMLAVCMLFYGFTHRFWDRLPDWVMILFCVLATVLTARLANGVLIDGPEWLFPFGFIAEGFYSADYFPLFPWLFVFLFGTWLGEKIRAGKLPEGFYTYRVPLFPAVGRHALLIYILHQPVLLLITLGIGAIFGIL